MTGRSLVHWSWRGSTGEARMSTVQQPFGLMEAPNGAADLHQHACSLPAHFLTVRRRSVSIDLIIGTVEHD